VTAIGLGLGLAGEIAGFAFHYCASVRGEAVRYLEHCRSAGEPAGHVFAGGFAHGKTCSTRRSDDSASV